MFGWTNRPADLPEAYQLTPVACPCACSCLAADGPSGLAPLSGTSMPTNLGLPDHHHHLQQQQQHHSAMMMMGGGGVSGGGLHHGLPSSGSMGNLQAMVSGWVI